MTFLLLIAVIALVVLAACAVLGVHLVADRRQLHAVAAKLIAEQRIEHATRATLQAMRDAAKPSGR